MSKIIDYKGQVQDIYNTTVALSRETEITWLYEQEAKSKLAQCQPTLMFYGVYNAGKSTLLNAIMGQAIASVADVPETHQVTGYSWNGYELFDTPGINGPEKDYKLSRSEIVKHDVIMFLVDDSDTFDNRLVAEEIVGIIESNKPLILIMNNKQTIDGENDDNGIAKRAKLYQNISTIGAERGISNITNRFSFIMIDAETAFNAKLEGKQLLLEESNLEDLELLILKNLKERDGFKALLPSIIMIANQLTALQQHLQKQLTSTEEQELVALIEYLDERRSLLLSILKSKVNFKLETAKNSVFIKLNSNESADVELANLNKELEQLLNMEITNVMADVTQDIERFLIRVQSHITIDSVQFDEIVEIDAVPQVEKKLEMSTAELATEAISNIAKNQLVIKGSEKILAKAVLPKIIAAPIPIVNVLLVATTVMEVISMFSKYKEQRAQQEHAMREQAAAANAQQQEMATRRIQMMQQLRTQLDIEFFRMNEEILMQVNENVKIAFDEYIQNIQQQLDSQQKVQSNVTALLQQIEQVKNEIELVKVQIS